jgi:putative endonuclease
MFWVYILRSDNTGVLYVGHTENLPERVDRHNAGTACRYTRSRGPWQLVYSERHPTRSEAMARERFLKSVSGSREKKRLAGVAQLG